MSKTIISLELNDKAASIINFLDKPPVLTEQQYKNLRKFLKKATYKDGTMKPINKCPSDKYLCYFIIKFTCEAKIFPILKPISGYFGSNDEIIYDMVYLDKDFNLIQKSIDKETNKELLKEVLNAIDYELHKKRIDGN